MTVNSIVFYMASTQWATTLLKSAGKFHVLVTILHTQKIIKIHQFILKILNGNKILTSVKGHNSVEK